jgi:hypothetical protein
VLRASRTQRFRAFGAASLVHWLASDYLRWLAPTPSGEWVRASRRPYFNTYQPSSSPHLSWPDDHRDPAEAPWHVFDDTTDHSKGAEGSRRCMSIAIPSLYPPSTHPPFPPPSYPNPHPFRQPAKHRKSTRLLRTDRLTDPLPSRRGALRFRVSACAATALLPDSLGSAGLQDYRTAMRASPSAKESRMYEGGVARREPEEMETLRNAGMPGRAGVREQSWPLLDLSYILTPSEACARRSPLTERLKRSSIRWVKCQRLMVVEREMARISKRASCSM